MCKHYFGSVFFFIRCARARALQLFYMKFGNIFLHFFYILWSCGKYFKPELHTPEKKVHRVNKKKTNIFVLKKWRKKRAKQTIFQQISRMFTERLNKCNDIIVVVGGGFFFLLFGVRRERASKQFTVHNSKTM